MYCNFSYLLVLIGKYKYRNKTFLICCLLSFVNISGENGHLLSYRNVSLCGTLFTILIWPHTRYVNSGYTYIRIYVYICRYFFRCFLVIFFSHNFCIYYVVLVNVCIYVYDLLASLLLSSLYLRKVFFFNLHGHLLT